MESKVTTTYDFDSETDMLDWTRERNNQIQATLILWNFDEWLRGFVKYNDKEDWPDAEAIREKLYEYYQEYNYEP